MLWFWVIVLVVLIGAVAVVASGRGDAMAEVYEDRPDVGLPTGRRLTADDLRSIRFNTGVRGYRMDEVDALLVRLRAELLEREGAASRPPDAEPDAEPDSEPDSQSESGQSESGQSDAAQSDAAQSDAAQSDAAQSDAAQTRVFDATSE